MVPKEGSILWFDMLAIPKDAPDPQSAYAFMNYMMLPQVSADVSDFRRYATANAAAQPLLQPAVRDDPGIYPPLELRQKLAVQIGGFGRSDSRDHAGLAKIQDGPNNPWRPLSLRVGRLPEPPRWRLPAAPSKRRPGGILPPVPMSKWTASPSRFGEFKAVDDVSLKIYKREIFCLLGASGCGKTTLLRMLGGFETPTSGRIFIDGEDMTGVPPYERPVNMMFQSYALFPHMTVEQNVAFGLKQDRVPKGRDRRACGHHVGSGEARQFRQT